jgi:hypothetical protein
MIETCNSAYRHPAGLVGHKTIGSRRTSPVGKQRKARCACGQPYDKKPATGAVTSAGSNTSLVVNASNMEFVNLRKARQCKFPTLEVNETNYDEVYCELSKWLKLERPFVRNPLQLYQENSSIMDNIDGAMRDEEVLNLRFLQGYFNLLPETFARAVSIIDHFVLKVRVKPKYMACVATAAYYMAILLQEELQDRPSKEELVTLTRCGGTTDDLSRMIDIIQTKLSDELLTASTAVDFAMALMRKRATKYPAERFSRIVSRILVGLTSLYVYQFPVPAIAFASFLLDANASEAVDWLEGGQMYCLAQFCGVPMVSVKLCAEYLQNMYALFYQRSLPSSRDRLIWCLSHRTRSKLSSVKSTHLDEKLYPIIESNEHESDA